MRIDVYHHDSREDAILAALKSIHAQLRIIQGEEVTELANLADVQAAVTAEDTVIDSAVALVNGLAAEVKALAPNQAAIDALAADITAKSTALASAVAANTPAAPPAGP